MAAAWAIGGAVLGGLGGFFGASDSNRQSKKAAQRQNKYNKEVYEFQYGGVDDEEIGGEALRNYNFAVEGLEITRKNNENNLRYQEYQSLQRYNYDMGIKAYEDRQANRIYEQSASRALQTATAAQIATQAANVDQNRLYHEQLIDLSMDETQTLFNFGMAAAGIGLKQRAAQTAAVTEIQKTNVQALKAIGATQARGVSGRSSARNVQGILAESGLNQAAVVDKLMHDLEATDQELFAMNQQLVMDQVGFEFSRDSARLSHMAEKNKIQAQALQTIINAEHMIALKPEIQPAMPRPIALPRPEYQDVYKPAKPPKPMKSVAMTTNPFLAGLSGAISGAQSGLSIGSGITNNFGRKS